MQMQKATLALLILLLAVSLTGLALFYSESLSGEGGAGRGHGAQVGLGTQGYGSLWLVVFAIPLICAIILVAYKALFPEIKKQRHQTPSPIEEVPAKADAEPALQAVLRVLNPDEKKVVEVLAAAQGSMLQKDIRWKTGLTRVQTHRVLARLAERDIIHLEKHYNTNKVTLADWVTKTETTGNKL